MGNQFVKCEPGYKRADNSFHTGYFGQNIPFPGYSEPLGFWLSTVLLLGLATGLWASFKRRGWL